MTTGYVLGRIIGANARTWATADSLPPLGPGQRTARLYRNGTEAAEVVAVLAERFKRPWYPGYHAAAVGPAVYVWRDAA